MMSNINTRLATAMFLACGLATPAPAAEPPLKDKTLVVWAAPAELNIRGGSALTIDNNKTHFDGIIYGELERRRWMAGSDWWRRSKKQQADWPEETTDPKTFVQIAITYKDKQVTIYRNGKKYAEYLAAPSLAILKDCTVLIGRRHLDSVDQARFAGRIDDARIYNAVLTAEQIAALKPNEASEPKPWAWWTFDNSDAKEKTGRFIHTTLTSGTKVENGHLVLDGRGDLIATTSKTRPAPENVATLPPLPKGAVDVNRAYREHLLADPHRPGYHFVIPEGRAMPFDPNGAIYWKGRYHLFYIFQDNRGHNWGHVSSKDLFHWRHHPTKLVSGMFSGNCFVNKDGVPTMCYHQVGQGNAMAVALDDDLNDWKKLQTNPITPATKPGDKHHGKYRSWDPFGWREGDMYYAIFGGKRPAIAKCATLGGDWKYTGDLLARAAKGVSINEDVSCADFFKLGNKHMLLCISHRLGCRYYLGEWKNEQFHPEFHERMSWVDNSYFAPESLLDAKGRRIMWAWIFDSPGFKTRTNFTWSGTMSLPRVLALGDDGKLRMTVPEEIKSLRYNPRSKDKMAIKADSNTVLSGINGNSLEVNAEIDPGNSKQCGVQVCCSPDGEERTLVYYDATDKKLKIDTTRSSSKEGPKSIEGGPLVLKDGEPLKLRVFVDKSVVEVFANDGRQAVMRRIYPARKDSVGVRLFAKGGDATVTKIEAWDMMPSNPY